LFRIDRKCVKLVNDINRQSSCGSGVESEYLSVAEAEINEKAEEILSVAREEARAILQSAHDEFEKERKRGFEQGYEEGVAENKRFYDEELAKKKSEDDNTLNRVLSEIYGEHKRIYMSMEGEVVNLALEIVKKIINPAEDELGTVFPSLIKNALRQFSTESKIIIHVSASDYERFFSSGATTIELDSGKIITVTVMSDVSLADGDCIIDTDDFTVNAGVDSQLKLVELAFDRVGKFAEE